MRTFVLLSLLVSIVVCDLTCTADQVYVKVSKKCASWAYEESYEIYSGSTMLVTSPIFSEYETRVSEYCLASSTNQQYIIKMYDGYGDSWAPNTWLQIQGEYGNTVFKNFMTEYEEESHPFSLYYAIKKSQEWKVEYGLSTISADWIKTSFSDSNWKTVNLGAPAETTSGAQYFRKTFTGLADMAAYELQMNYKFGVIAYINGNEIFRDNMADGAVNPATLSSGSYQEVGYHGIIRPAAEVAASSSVLAVELHFSNAAGQDFINFDAYLAIYAATVPEDKCFIYPYATTITSTASTSADKMFDFDRNSEFYVSSYSIPATVNVEFTGPRPFVNGIRVWPYTSPNSAPGTFTWQGTMSATGTWTDIMSASDALYDSQVSRIYYGYFNAQLFKSYRFTNMKPSVSLSLYAYEVQPVICAVALPTSIEFEESSFTVYAKYETIMVKPKIDEFTGCTVNPALPDGLTLDATTCTVSGTITNALSATTYTMSSTMAGHTYTGTFTVTALGCEGTLVKLLRVYKYNAYQEAFTIKDAATQQVVFEVAANSGQPNNEDVTYIACLTGAKYTITTDSTVAYWSGSSYLYVNAMLSDTEYETMRRIHYDTKLGVPTVHTINAQYQVKAGSQWYYKMGEVPANWYNSETSGWTQAAIGTFPESTNQIQLYKATFNVASVDNVAGFVITLRYKYGCIVYMNGNEVFRNGVDGDLTTASMADNVYTTVKYRQISLPIKTMAIDEAQSVNYIQQGANTIAVALIAINANQKTSVFDGAVRLMGEGTVSRVFDYTVNYNDISGSAAYICDDYYGNSMYSYYCEDNYWSITFNDDRREWISGILIRLYYDQGNKHVKQFTVKARNGDDEWTTIKTVTDLTWSLIGQHKKLWFENNKPYNQYRIENIASGDPNNCDWKLGPLDFNAASAPADIPNLVYPPNVEIYKDIEMGEVYSNSDYYFDFTINPALPAGITMDPHNGMISGTATEEKAATVHTITAKKFGGGTATVTINFSVGICTGGKGLITLVVQADGFPHETSWKLFKGKGTTGEVLRFAETLRVANSLNYGDFCVPHDFYTVQLKDSWGDGMQTSAGYYLTVDLGEMVVETGQLPSGPKEDNTVSTMFTSNIPFQIEYDTWKLNNNGLTEGWNTIDFDDSTWTVKKAAEFGPHVGTTAYIRREVTIPDIAQYYVLNIRVKYAGGIVAYFNGHKVARFNLEENFNEASEAIGPHDTSLFSKFHIVLSTVGAVTGKNVIAFEIHRNNVESNIIFDATGVYGINDCSVVVDTYSKIEGDTNLEDPSELFNLMPQTKGYIVNTKESKIEWTVENLEGSKFNSFGMQPTSTTGGLGFSVYARWSEEEDYVSAIALLKQSVESRKRSAWPMDVGIAGFKEFKYEIDAPSNGNIYFYSFITQYCKPTGTNICPGIDDYPSVGEGQISPAPCAYGFRGYSYRECNNGQLGAVKEDKCVYKLPDKLSYDRENYVFVKDTKITTGEPTKVNIIEKYYVQAERPLPEGLTINEKTGEITGTPVAVMDVQTFTIRGSNPVGETATTITISVRKGVCQPEGVFERTNVGEIAVYDCAIQGSYVGTQKRACILGQKDGEWQKATGFCMPIFGIVTIVLVVIIIVVVVILLLVRSRKTKAVGGIKGKSAKASSKKNLSKKVSSKAVKV